MKKLSWYRAVCLLPLLLLLLGAAPSSVQPSPTLPKGVEPLPPELHRRMDELVRTAEERRGLRLKRAVVWGWLGPEVLREKVAEELRQDLPAEELRPLEAALKAFGLIPEMLDVAAVYTDVLTRQIAGFYDPEAEYMALVRRGEGAPEAPNAGDDMVLVHEVVHAIQDQHFDLEAFTDLDPMSDAAAARSALVEGDATWTMMKDAGGIDPEALERGASLDGDMPAWFEETLLFSYFRGLAFCRDVRAAGGQALVDRAFTLDPPRSTEQILHPEKWIGRRDEPVAVVWPDLSAALPGHAKAAEGELGELGIRILLTGQGAKDRKAAEAAAAGWGGDRFAVYEKDGRRVLAWITVWDAEAEAAGFEAAARALGADWDVRRVGARRVQVVRGLEGETLAAVQGALKPGAAKGGSPADTAQGSHPGLREGRPTGLNRERQILSPSGRPSS